ncbi:MAG: transporter substrate-binding domain-containing protein [Rhizobiales bacterium]|nr:transporter substrate-binding domain-containing protein [Hyphomicrobiales bacterium]
MKFAYLIEPPFNFRDGDGLITGCDVELAEHVFLELGVSPFEPVETEFSELLPGVSAGRWQMTTGLFETEERRETASFSRPIWALPDGLLVKRDNPLQIQGYRSIAKNSLCVLAVIRDQFQHRSAVEFAIPANRIAIFETYNEAAIAVRDGLADAYASVGRAHSGFMRQFPDWALEIVEVPASEKAPAYGSFAFSLTDTSFRNDVDGVLERYLGSPDHRKMMGKYGFTDAEIDLLIS